MDDIHLSAYGGASANPSPVNRMMAACATGFRSGVDINLGVGYVNEQAIPRRAIGDAYRRVLSDTERYRGALNYGPPAGVPELIEAIRRWRRRRGGHGATGDRRIIIGSSGATSLLEAAAAIVKPGIVVTSDPVYYIYTDLLERCGFELLAVPEDREGIDADQLEEKLGRLGRQIDQLSFFYLVTVANPTCTILSPGRLRRLVSVATDLSRRLGRKVPLLLDTAYEPLVHDPVAQRPESDVYDDPLGLVYEIGSLSKILAPALRIGYMIGQDGPFMTAMVQRASDAVLGPPPLNQQVAAVLLDHQLADGRATTVGAYGRKAARVRTWIDRYLGHAVADCRGGRAGFYFYLTLENVQTHERSPFFRFLARTTGDLAIDGDRNNPPPRVIYVPGEFCTYRQGDLVERSKRQLRISYAYEDAARIETAIRLIAQAIAYAH